MKKLIKAVFIFCILTIPYLYISQQFFISFFSFSLISPTDWQAISLFLEKGGVIKSSQDLLLLLAIALNPIIFLILWRFFYKKSFINIILYPIVKYNKMVVNRYGQNSKRIVLKNICRHVAKKDVSDELRPNIEASKKASQSIREAVREKLTNN